MKKQTDSSGAVFDQKIHQIRYGKPLIRKKDGCFALKKSAKNSAKLLGFRTKSHVPDVETSETTVSAETFVDDILDAGESVPTLPPPSAENLDAQESFIPDDLNFPEEEFDATAEEKPKMSAESASISAFSIVEITEQTAAVLLGEEMEMKSEEKKRLISAWENYLATTEGVALPPWAALIGLNALYFGTRLMLPNVQNKLKRIWDNLNGKHSQQPVPAQNQSVVS